jgi:Dolichyl-phosphate-mannose-protein mannosyltransferase
MNVTHETAEAPRVDIAPIRESAQRGRVWWWQTAMLSLALVVGSVLRIVGVRFGLPLRVHADEFAVVDYAIDLAARNSFEPTIYDRPDHFEIKLDYLVFSAYSHLVEGVPADVAFEADPNQFYVLARLVTALFGIAMIVLAFLIGRRFGRTVGVLAASITALWPPFVKDSHYATPDVPLAFALMLAIYFCIAYIDEARLRNIVLASVCVGASITIKYPGAIASAMIAAVVVAAAIRDHDRLRILRHGVAASMSMIVTTFAISPVLFTNIAAVRDMFRIQLRTAHLGVGGLGWSGNAQFYLQGALTAGGVILSAAIALGAFWTIRERSLRSLPLWLGVVYLVALSSVGLHWGRWAMPMYLTGVFLAPIGMHRTYLWARVRWRRATPVASGLLLGISFAHLGTAALTTTVTFTLPDTRNEVAGQLHDLGIDASNTVFEGYTPFKPGAPDRIFDSIEVRDGELTLIGDAADADVDYVMLSSGMFTRYESDPKYRAVYAEIRQLPEILNLRPDSWVPSRWETVSIPRSLAYLARAWDGGLTGPELEVYDASGVARYAAVGGR